VEPLILLALGLKLEVELAEPSILTLQKQDPMIEEKQVVTLRNLT
jgi:hypothetical protein